MGNTPSTHPGAPVGPRRHPTAGVSLLLEFGRPTGCLPKRRSARPDARRKQQVNFLEVQKAFLRALFQRTVRVRVKQAWKLMQQSFRNGTAFTPMPSCRWH